MSAGTGTNAFVITERDLKLIEGFEGFVDHQYRDSVGVLTIGYGTTGADVSPLPTHLTQAQAESLLKEKLETKYLPPVRALGVPLNPNQVGALVSLAYNVGPGVLSWQIGVDLKARDYTAASADFMHYVYAGGRVLQGLVNRRTAERMLFDTPWVDPDPHHYLWFDDTMRELGKLGTHSERSVCEHHYDPLRALQTSDHHPHREELQQARDVCSALASRLDHVIEHTGDGHTDHRSWRRRQLEARANGRRMV